METKRSINRLGGEGVLVDSDITAFSEAKEAILDLMRDGGWHPASRIIAAGGQRESLRRLRDFRAIGFVVDRRRDGTSRDFLYQLNPQSKTAKKLMNGTYIIRRNKVPCFGSNPSVDITLIKSLTTQVKRHRSYNAIANLAIYGLSAGVVISLLLLVIR